MIIKALFFGITTDLVGTSQLEIKIPKNTSVNDFKETLKVTYPQLQHINSYSIAVNESYADDDLVLQENDVVAVIPPVSGG